MKFTPEQHFRMADSLLENALNQTDTGRVAKLVAMARVFRRLAVNAYMEIDTDMKRRDWSAFNVDGTFPGLIDSPTPWDSLEEWERYLRDLDRLPRSKLLRGLVETAEETIVRKKLGLL